MTVVVSRARWSATAAILLLACVTVRADPVADALHSRMDELQFAGDLEINGARVAARVLLPDVYAGRDFAPMWPGADRVEQLLELLETAPAHGLDPTDYYIDELRALVAESRASDDPVVAANLDILATESLVRFGYHQLFGKVNPSALDANINFSRRFFNDQGPVESLPVIIASDVPFVQQVDQAIYRNPIYRDLQGHLATYREIEADGGWPLVPEGATLREGDNDPRVADLRRRLAATGDLDADGDVSSTDFDGDLKAAVTRFQQRHGLDADGVVGRQSYAAMNVPVEDRIDQLRLSLERLRWVRDEAVDRFVAVNIASFRVFLVDGPDIVWSSRVMVGTPYRETPIFRGNLQYMEINPTWTVPPGILRKDVLPAIKRDPGYLAAKNMILIDRDGAIVDPDTVDWQQYTRGLPYTVRQQPGPNNALGEIKFIFPNKHFVFLHDTPSRALFGRSARAFSSGCIRVEHPFELAEKLLDDPEQWDRAALERVRDSRETQRITVPDRTAVLLVYLTASTDDAGAPAFFSDVYGRDPALLEALDGDVVIAAIEDY